MSLSRCERETIILFNEEEATATISTFSPAVKKKLDKLYGVDHSVDGLGELYADEPEARYEVPKGLISFRRKQTLTPEQMEAKREAARKAFGHAKK